MRPVTAWTLCGLCLIVGPRIARAETIDPARTIALAAEDGNGGGTADSSVVKASYLLTGLHCPPCASTVEQSLKRTRGVRSVRVDWNTKNAWIEFDERVIPAQKVSRLIAATLHMMGGDMRYGGWLALRVEGVEDEKTASRVKEVLGKVEGVSRVAVYPNQGGVGIAFGAKGNVSLRQLIAALDAAGLKGSAYTDSPRKTGQLSTGNDPHAGMAMGAGQGHGGMRHEMSCPGCQGGMRMGTAGQESPAPASKIVRPAGFSAGRRCGC
jgi:copper chaperone CopZ